MVQALAVRRLVETVYDAAIDATAWRGVTDLAAEAFGCTSTGVGVTGGGTALIAQTGVDNSMWARYLDRHRHHNFFGKVLMRAPRGRVVALQDLDRDPRFRSHPFYDDYLRGIACNHIIGIQIDGEDGMGVGLTLGRNGQRFDQADMVALAGLVPHLTRVTRLRALLQRKASGEAAGPAPEASALAANAASRLPPAEADVMRLLVEGLTVKEIAQIRSVSFETVRFQVKSILRKMGARNQKQLIALAARVPVGGHAPAAGHS